MRKFISIALVGVLSFSVSYGAVNKVPKGERKIHRFEPSPSEHSVLGQGSSKIVMPNTRNGGYFALVDSSTNGFGMVAANTRPLFVDPENTGYWFSAYRQFCGLLTTHGQLGGAFSEDGEDWTTYTNLNSNGNPPWGGGGVGGAGVGQARYPSAIGTEDMPIAVWNEYTGITTFGSLYGGRPYFAYDEFGWDGGSFAYPIEGDLLWSTDAKDLWVGSTSVSYDSDLGMPVVNTAYNDWTRGSRWLFHSEYVDDEVIIMGEEQKVLDETNDLEGGEGGSGYNTSPYVSCTPEGICGVGVIGLFQGGLDDLSDVSDNHTGIFKMSEDHGASWHGCAEVQDEEGQGCAPSFDGNGYYFIPDGVWTDLIETQFNYEYEDECEGSSTLVNDFWSYYEDDFKVDRDGNPHFVIQVTGCDDEFCYLDLPESGIYHFTINKEYLDNPGQINTATGWNWRFVMTGAATWGWADMTGETYIWNNHNSLAFSVEDRDVMYIVTDLATEGDFAGDSANLEDPCYYATWQDYPEWSEDIYVLKSEDGGDTWSNPLNVTDTPDEIGIVCPSSYPKCDPAEEYPHAAQWATDDEVYFQYQMPNWEFNEIGDLTSADFMNRVYIGYAVVDNIAGISEYEYDGGGSGCYADAGDVTGDGIINVLDIISVVNHILSTAVIGDICAADYTDDGIVNVLDIIAMVNYILGSRLNSASEEILPAEKVVINPGVNLSLEYDSGNVQGIYLVLDSSKELDIDWSENLYQKGSHYDPINKQTSLIAVTAPGVDLKNIAVIKGDYRIVKSEVGVVSKTQPKMLDAKDVTISGSFSGSTLPNGYRIGKAYPNPFNPSTSFEIDLDNESFVSVKVYNVVGQLTQELYSGNMTGHGNAVHWNASNIASGIYFVKIQVGNNVESQKVLLVK